MIDPRAKRSRNSATLSRVCLTMALAAGSCSPSWAQGKFDFTYSGSGISAGRSILSTFVGRPRSAEHMLLSALAYERNGSIQRAEAEYAHAVRRSNFAPSVGLAYAGFLQRRGGIERAGQFLTQLSRRWPKNPEILSALAQIHLTRQDWAAALAMADSIRDAGDTRGMAEQVRRAALIGQGKVDESIAVFQSAAEASPSAVQPMTFLVAALVRARQIDRAVAFLTSALQENPDNADAHVLMGSIQLASGEPDQALQSFKLAIEKQPRNVAGYQALARFYVGERKFDAAIAVVRSGLRMQPDSMILHLVLMGALERAGQYEAAIAESEHMLSKQPGSMIVMNNLASLLADRRDDKASLERAHSLAASLQASDVPQFMDTVGWISYRRGDYVNSVPLLTKAVVALPDRAMVLYHLAMSYIANNQAADASEQLKAALSLAPDSELDRKIREALKRLPPGLN